MLNVYSGVKKYGLDGEFLAAAKELAAHPESGLFMKKGTYAIVEIGRKYQFPPTKLAFTTASGVIVTAGDDFAMFQHDGKEYVLWRTESIPNNPDAPMVA